MQCVSNENVYYYYSVFKKNQFSLKFFTIFLVGQGAESGPIAGPSWPMSLMFDTPALCDSPQYFKYLSWSRPEEPT